MVVLRAASICGKVVVHVSRADAGITAKIGRFLFSASAKRILEQEKSTIDFDAILDGKILICNFSKGMLGEDTSALFGTTVLTKQVMAILCLIRKKNASSYRMQKPVRRS